MADETCLQYPDIYEELPGDATELMKEKHAGKVRVYRAVRHVLKENFNLGGSIPEDPKGFATAAPKLPRADVAQFAGILGLIKADNWEDSTNSKAKPSADDLTYPNVEKFVIDRRFVEAVVEAVKEYTAASKLFNKVYDLMHDEAAKGLKPAAGKA
jgi:hypothetical protein